MVQNIIKRRGGGGKKKERGKRPFAHEEERKEKVAGMRKPDYPLHL